MKTEIEILIEIENLIDELKQIFHFPPIKILIEIENLIDELKQMSDFQIMSFDNRKFLTEIFKMNINELRIELYKKYSCKEIGDKLGVSEIQVSRLLHGHSTLSFERFKILIGMIKNDK